MNTIKSVGIVGAGQMGAGIAQVCATLGLTTILFDAHSPALDKGTAGIYSRLERLVEKGTLSGQDCSLAKERLQKAGSLKDFSACDLVIEAIVEQFEPKASLFRELDHIIKKDTLLASNTSSISITRLAAVTKSPQNFMGIHFMNPVPVMQLVELIRGLQTSDESYNRVVNFCETIKKSTILAVDGPGFVVNRILCPMINEAIFLVQEGVLPADIDAGMKLGTNHPMGPLELADFVGLDTLLFILEILQRELGDDKYRPCPLLRKYVEAGWYGKKSGKGFYSYSN